MPQGNFTVTGNLVSERRDCRCTTVLVSLEQSRLQSSTVATKGSDSDKRTVTITSGITQIRFKIWKVFTHYLLSHTHTHPFLFCKWFLDGQCTCLSLLQVLCPSCRCPSSLMNATPLCCSPQRSTSQTSGRPGSVSLAPGSTPSSGPCRPCWDGVATGQRDREPHALSSGTSVHPPACLMCWVSSSSVCCCLFCSWSTLTAESWLQSGGWVHT